MQARSDQKNDNVRPRAGPAIGVCRRHRRHHWASWVGTLLTCRRTLEELRRAIWAKTELFWCSAPGAPATDVMDGKADPEEAPFRFSRTSSRSDLRDAGHAAGGALEQLQPLARHRGGRAPRRRRPARSGRRS